MYIYILKQPKIGAVHRQPFSSRRFTAWSVSCKFFTQSFAYYYYYYYAYDCDDNDYDCYDYDYDDDYY